MDFSSHIPTIFQWPQELQRHAGRPKVAGSALQESHGPAGAAADGPRGVAGGCGYSLSGEGGLGEVVRTTSLRPHWKP